MMRLCDFLLIQIPVWLSNFLFGYLTSCFVNLVILYVCLLPYQVIKNPVTEHLPIGCKKIGMSFKAEKCVDPRTLVPTEEPIVFVIGAMAHGSVRIVSESDIHTNNEVIDDTCLSLNLYILARL